MTAWNLKTILGNLHEEIQSNLSRARSSIGHPGEKGDVSEDIWLELFQEYLPARYHALKAHVVDSEGTFSDQIDVVIFDRQYSPFIHKFQNSTVIPAESVYAVFEAKQTMNVGLVNYSHKKIASVRELNRTSLPIPHAGGEYPAKPPFHIIGGLLCLESDWNPPFGDSFHDSVNDGSNGSFDLGCVAAHGFFYRDMKSSQYIVDMERKPATGFLFKLISQLQLAATVPMIDVEAYSKWLTD